MNLPDFNITVWGDMAGAEDEIRYRLGPTIKGLHVFIWLTLSFHLPNIFILISLHNLISKTLHMEKEKQIIDMLYFLSNKLDSCINL